jgi:hypothetical protein
MVMSEHESTTWLLDAPAAQAENGGPGRMGRRSRREGQTEGRPDRTEVAALVRPGTSSTLAARRLRFAGHHGMEEVRGSSPPKAPPAFPLVKTESHRCHFSALFGSH